MTSPPDNTVDLTLEPPSRNRKRKAEEAIVDLTGPDLPSRTKQAKLRGKQSGLVSPPLTEGTMNLSDSDEMYPDGSEEEELADSQEEAFDDDDLGDGYDDDFGTQSKELRPSKKPFEVDYDIKSPSQIHDIQQDFINDTSAILGESSERCAILLRYFKWNKERLIENYLERRGRTLELAGLDTSGAFSQPKAIAGFMCDICCDDDEGLQTFALKCDHRFCTDCYGRYLSQKIIEEGEAANITCPGEKCTMIVDSHTVKLMVKANVLSRYAELLDKAFIDSQNDLRWCSGPDCDKAIMCPVKKSQLRTVVPTVTCQCDFSFCFGCSREDHMPTPCYLVKLWLKKCADDSETANWISANTKECPVCSSTIEKNGGCNHMTCRKCKGEFCWICMGKWSEHGTAWYNCNRFEERSGLDARDAQAKSRHSLDRYLHYYNRYHNHDISGRQDRALYEKTQTKMSRLQASSGLSWIEVQFLSSAQQVLQQCRATLKWTYAFAFYLEQNNMTHIFESNQADLEMAVENLSEMFGKKEAELRDLKVEIMDRTSYCGKRRIILLSDTACNLNDDVWEFNVELTEDL